MEDYSAAYWREQEYLLAGMLLCAARQAKLLLDNSDAPDEFVAKVFHMCCSYANAFAPPGEPEQGYSADVVEMESWRARHK